MPKTIKRIFCFLGIHDWEYFHTSGIVYAFKREICKDCRKCRETAPW